MMVPVTFGSLTTPQRIALGVLALLIEAYPKAVDRERISEATEYMRPSRDTYIQRLRARELVEVESRGTVRAAEMLFA
jgi:hypothetical protein